MGGICSTYGEMKNAYKISFGKPEGKRPLGRPKHGYEVDVQVDNTEIGREDRDWIHLAQD
jgi:hypothetical protein